jgi:hypothetical protein
MTGNEKRPAVTERSPVQVSLRETTTLPEDLKVREWGLIFIMEERNK